MKICFIGSGTDCRKTSADSLEVGAVAEVVRRKYDQLVFGGSGIGLMQAFAQAFRDRGGSVLSVVPDWLARDGDVDCDSQVIRCSSLAERKQLMFAHIDALLCYPGGLGTLDELFDFLARHATAGSPECPPIYLYNWKMYYSPLLLQLETAEELGFVAAGAFSIIKVFGSAESLATLIE